MASRVVGYLIGLVPLNVYRNGCHITSICALCYQANKMVGQILLGAEKLKALGLNRLVGSSKN